MMQRSKNRIRLLALFTAVTMIAAFILPAATFASVTSAAAVAVTVENGEGEERSNKIVISFDEEVVLDDTDWKNNIVVSNGETDKIFGDGAEIVLDQTTLKDIVITLGTDSDIETGDTITFSGGIVKDALTQLEAFNESVTVEGTFEPAEISFVREPENVTVVVDGYETLPSKLGIGEFTYTAYADNYVTIENGSFSVTSGDLGYLKEIELKLEKENADYTALDSAVSDAEAINASDYTEESIAALASAVEAAKALDRNLKFDEQSQVDAAAAEVRNASDNLARAKEVGFIAVAVSSDAAEDYAKADKIVLAFSEPIEDDADIISNLSISEDVISAQWIDGENTVYELLLDEKSDLKNGLELRYTENSKIKTVSGYVLKSYQTTVAGNLEGVSGFVTATAMAATIVKSSARPGVSSSDRIVVVFNAPVKNNPDSIEFVTDMGEVLIGNAIENTSNTVYEIILSERDAVRNETTLSYGDIVNVHLNGSFGSAEAPKAIKAYAVDNDGTAVTAGDNIIILFDRPTNGKEITASELAGCIITGTQGASLGNNSSAAWEDDFTKLVITIGDTAAVANGITINIGNLGIKDEYEIADAVGEALVIEGSFGYTIEPRITKAVAFTQNGLDYIRVFFNTEVKGNGTVDATISDFKAGIGAKSGLVQESGFTYYEIVMEKDEHGPFESGKHTISLSGVVDKETGTKSLSQAPVTITGAFVAPIVPELMSVTAVSKDGSGVAKSGDKIVAVFNTDVTIGSIDVSEGNFGTDAVIGYAENSRNLIEITLGGSNIRAIPGTTKLTFNSFRDYETESEQMSAVSKTLGGSFGYSISPEILSMTAISRDGSGAAKAGDKVIVVFNTAVENVSSQKLGGAESSDGYVWTFTVAADNAVSTGEEIAVTAVSSATGSEKEVKATLGGSFGYTFPDPKILSVTAVSNDGSGVSKVGDEVIVVFDIAVESVSSDLGTVKASESSCVWTITLNKSVSIGDTLTLAVTPVGGNAVLTFTPALTGSFGNEITPEILSALAVSQDGSGIAKSGDKIIVVFNTAVEGVTSSLGSVKASDNKYVWTIILKNDNSISVGDDLSFTVTNAATGKAYEVEAVLGGSFGYSEAPAVKSVVLSESNGTEIITVIFGSATNEVGIDVSVLENNNGHIGRQGVSAAWENEYVLKITLGTDAQTTSSDILNLSGIGIAGLATGETITGIDALPVSGSLIPVVETVDASDKEITVKFSTRTNGKADLSIFKTLLGIGARSAWSDNNKTLTITLGENYSITDGGYIVLNGMGITDGFSGKYALVGQYKVSGSIGSDRVSVISVTAQSSDKSVITAQKGDSIIIRFNTSTDANGAEIGTLIGCEEVDKIIGVNGIDNEAAFGTGYDGVWTSYDTFVITLGGAEVTSAEDGGDAEMSGFNPQISVGDMIAVSGIKLAGGNGEMDAAEFELGGSFNGREFVVTEGAITRTNEKSGDFRVQAKIENTLLSPIVPTVVCVAYKGKDAVAISRICVDIETSITPVFEFSGSYGITKAEIYVFNDLFSDMSSAPDVLAETLEIIY